MLDASRTALRRVVLFCALFYCCIVKHFVNLAEYSFCLHIIFLVKIQMIF